MPRPPQISSRAFPVHAVCAALRLTPSRLTPSRRAPRPACIARPPFDCTRQGASDFNQPLSFDTSSVTTMYNMFSVRSAHALSPKP